VHDTGANASALDHDDSAKWVDRVYAYARRFRHFDLTALRELQRDLLITTGDEPRARCNVATHYGLFGEGSVIEIAAHAKRTDQHGG
jgi:hypothetical protein